MEKTTYIKQICKTCEKEFTMRDEDIAFYLSINSNAPDYCHTCRFTKRLVSNEKRGEWSNPLK